MTDEPILLTARQAAALLSVSPQKVRNLIADQRLRAVHIDRCVRIHRDDLETFAASCSPGDAASFSGVCSDPAVARSPSERRVAPATPPIGGESPPLWAHQEDDRVRLPKHGCTAGSRAMGTGKSRVVIELIKRRRHSLTLIIAPKAVAQNVWEGQLERFAPPHIIPTLNLSDGATGEAKGRTPSTMASENCRVLAGGGC
jgi:excisionase family DNA binding protein